MDKNDVFFELLRQTGQQIGPCRLNDSADGKGLLALPEGKEKALEFFDPQQKIEAHLYIIILPPFRMNSFFCMKR